MPRPTATIAAAPARTLYANYGLRRVYYSAFSPIPDASAALPLQAAAADARAPALSGRLADALLRLRRRRDRRATDDGMLDLDIDPKLAWALRHRDRFPVDVNTASREDAAARARARHEGRRADPRVAPASARCGSTTSAGCASRCARVRPFIVTADHHAGAGSRRLRRGCRATLAPRPAAVAVWLIMRSRTLRHAWDFDGWRDARAALLAAGIAPEQVVWQVAGGDADLFGNARPPPPRARRRVFRAARPRRARRGRRSAIAIRSVSRCSTRCCGG